MFLSMSLKTQIAQIRPILIAVVFNLLLTLTTWVLVFKTEMDDSSIAFYLMNSDKSFTTGNNLYDGFLNAIICVSILAIISFVMLIFALYEFKEVVNTWLNISCLMVNYFTPAYIFRGVLVSIGIETNVTLIVVFISAIYGTVGSIAFFTNRLPSMFHKFFVVCNCSMVSVYYLRILPGATAWFLPCIISIWDLFTVLSAFGPLRRIEQMAHDYDEQTLKMVTFDTVTRSDTEMLDENDVTASSSLSAIEDEKVDPPNKVSRTAYDALQDADVARLGMGDFVFYSILVGKAAASGSVPATLNAMVGVVVGLVITLVAFADNEETIPALPISITLGMLFHFGTVFVSEPISSYLISLFV
ncbi:presenilin domain-containing protein [Ditylenchus destructor]|nr:presenilin domain-containing protein [Ditylenchus destructor]